VDKHPNRKLSKKWVTEKVKLVADKGVRGGWVIKPAALGLPEGGAGPGGEPRDKAVPMEEGPGGLPPPADAGAMLKFLGKVKLGLGGIFLISLASASLSL